MRSHDSSRQAPAAPAPAPARRGRAGLQSQAGNRAVASLLQSRSVQRAPDDDPTGIIEQTEKQLALARGEAGIFNTAWDVGAGVQDFVHQVPGVGEIVPEAAPTYDDAMATYDQMQQQLSLARAGTGIVDTARDVGAGVQNFVHQLPGMGEASEPIVTSPTVYGRPAAIETSATVYERPAPIETPPTVYGRPAPIETPPTVYERP